jgi:type III secretion system OrgA/MxiK family protein
MHNVTHNALHTIPGRMESVMFDPLRYIHPARLTLPPGFESPAQRAAINALLLTRYALPALPPPPTAGVQWLVKHWQRLPQVIYLLGCVHARMQLMRRGAVLQLPQWVQGFLRLPLPLPAFAVNHGNRAAAAPLHAPDHGVLLRHGMRQLERLAGGMPTVLRARAVLQLHPAYDVADAAQADADAPGDALYAGPRDLADAAMQAAQQALLLTMVIQHVKTNAAHG